MKSIGRLVFLWLALVPSWGWAQACSGSNNNNLFVLSGTNNATLSSINPIAAGTYNVALNAAVPNATNTGACFTVTVTGSGGVVTAGPCTATGTVAQNDLATAGFATCVHGEDFTQAIPNSAGTGLPSNWLNCTFGDATASVWYWGTWMNSAWVYPCVSGPSANASNSSVYQATDGGSLVLVLHQPYVNCVPNSPGDNFVANHCSSTIGSIPGALAGPPDAQWPNNGLFPSGYYEITYRTDSSDTVNTLAFWSMITPSEQLRTTGLHGGSNGFELDFMENVGAPTWDNGYISWYDDTTPCGSNPFACTYEYARIGQGNLDNNYHTYGALFTTDGSNRYGYCGYYDGAKTGCHTNAFGDTGDQNERRFVIWWGNTQGFKDTNVYVKSIKVISCASWQSTMCNGTLVTN